VGRRKRDVRESVSGKEEFRVHIECWLIRVFWRNWMGKVNGRERELVFRLGIMKNRFVTTRNVDARRCMK
jgi:hypothetical protein